MTLAEAQIRLSFAGGIETKADAKSVPTAKLLVLENAVFTKAVSLVKRNGYQAYSTLILGEDGSYSGARAIGKRGSELVLFTDEAAYSYSRAASRWSEIGAFQSVLVADSVVSKTNSEQTMADLATLASVTVVAWEDSRGGVYCSLVDESGRMLVQPRQLSATGVRPRVVVSGTRLHVYYVEAASGRIMVLVVNPATIEAAATDLPEILIDDLDPALPYYDAEGASDAATMAWYATTGKIRVAYIAPAGMIGTPGSGFSSPLTHTPAAAPMRCIAVTRNPNGLRQIAVVYAGLSSVRSFAVSSALVAGSEVSIGGIVMAHRVTAAFLRDETGGEVQYVAFWEATAAAPRDHIVRWATVNATTSITASSATTQRGCGLASRAFADGAYVYVHTVHETTYFSTYFLQRHSDGQVVARILPGLAGGVTSSAMLPGVHVTSTAREYEWASIYNVQLESQSGDQFTESGIRRQSLAFDSEQSHQSAPLGACLYVGGGHLWLYDGANLVEAQPHYAPDGEIAQSFGSFGSGGMTAGVRSYLFVPEGVTATGERIRGPVSIPYEVEVEASEYVEFSIPTIRHTAWRAPGSRLSIGVYRTVDGDASIYYRCSSLDPTTEGDPNGYVTNDPTADTVTFLDNLSDDDLQEREPFYGTGGVVENDPCPPPSILVQGKERLFFTDASDPYVVRYTKQRADGYTAEPSPHLALAVDQNGGRITGLAVMDDALVIFKESAIYVVSGEGPLAAPDLGGGFSAPALITTDVGCSNADSIATTPLGLVFQSAKGIYLLDRGRSTTYIGAPVEAYNAQRVTRATLVEGKTQVRFLTDSGVTLLYDYLFGQWSTFTNHEGLDALVLDGTYHYLRTDGRVFAETDGVYRDDNSQIRMRIETAWIRFRDALQGWQRIWHALILGEYKSPHVLAVSWAKDYSPQFTPPLEIDTGALYAAQTGYGDGAYGAGPYGGTGMESVGDAYQHKIHIGVHGQALRFRFEDREDSDDYGASFELTELLLTGGVLRGHAAVSPSRMA